MKQVSLGYVVGIFGLKGQFKLRPNISDEKVFKKLQEVYVGGVAVKVESASMHKENWLIKLFGVNTPEEAMTYKGKEVFIPAELLPALSENETYWIDIEGSSVVDEKGNHVGLLKDYMETGSHDVLVIDGQDGKEYLISCNPEHVKEIDVKNKLVKINSDGLVSAN